MKSPSQGEKGRSGQRWFALGGSQRAYDARGFTDREWRSASNSLWPNRGNFDPRQNRGVLRSSHSSRTQVRASFGQIVFLNSVILVKYMNCIYFVNFACIRILSDLFECENSIYNCVEMPIAPVQWNLFFNAEIAVPFLFEFKNPRQKLQMVR
jgi:hypothetical protein